MSVPFVILLRRAGLAALIVLTLHAAPFARADLIMYSSPGGPMQYNGQGPVAISFSLDQAWRIRAVNSWVYGGNEPGTISVGYGLPSPTIYTPLYSKTYFVEAAPNAPAKWQGVTGLKWDLQPGDYWLVFQGGNFPFGYGYHGPQPEVNRDAVVASEGLATLQPDEEEWSQTFYPFGLEVYAVPLTPTPEPATYGLFGALALAGVAWRRRSQSSATV